MADSPNIGKAYVQIVPSAQGIQGSVQSVLDPEAAKAGKTAGSKLSSGLGKAISGIGRAFVNVAAGGAAAISGISAAVTQSALSGGISRAIGLDDAQAKFRQLGFDVNGMMASVDESVTGTRYSMDQAASVAVNFGSAGIKAGKDMTNALKSVASVASISGRDFQDIGTIYTKVASQGKLTGETLNQLAENGVNANAALQKSLGKSKEEISAMVSSGQIDFETFSNAMSEYFGDASESANSTFSGALANVRANLSRLGASFMSPALSALRTVFAGTSDDTVGLIGAIKSLITYLDPVVQKFTQIADIVGTRLADSFNAFATTLDNTGSALQGIKAFFIELIPDSLAQKIQALPPSMQSLLGVLGKIGGAIAGVAAGWGVFSGAITMLAPGLARLLGPLLSVGGGFALVKSVVTNLLGVFTKMIPGLSGMGGNIGTLAGRLGSLAGPIGWAITAFTLMFANSEKFRAAIGGLVQTLASSLAPILGTIMAVIAEIMPVVGQLAGILGNALAPVIRIVSGLLRGLMTVLGAIVKVAAALVIPTIRAVGTVLGKLSGPISKAAAGISTFVAKVRSGFAKVSTAIATPINKAKEIIQSLRDKISSIFPLKLGKIFSGIKLPHFKISGGKIPWGIGGKGKKPSVDVEWYAQGGIVDGATIIGAGEAGAEAIVPLDPFWKKLDNMADSFERQNGGEITINVYAGQQDAREIAAEVERRIIDAQKRRRLAWA